MYPRLRTSALAATALISATLLLPRPAKAAYPERMVKFLVAFAPGGIADIVGRVVAHDLSERWGQTIVVDNRGGGGGNIGAGQVARAEPDGYTVLVTTSAFTVNLSLFKNPGYALSDFQVAAVVATSPNIVIAAPNLPYHTLPAILAAAKTEKLSFGSPGIGTTPQLAGEEIFHLIGKVDVRHVPFTGAGPAVAATMASQVPVRVVALPAAYDQVKAGMLQGIAIMTPQRLPDLPDVPTIKKTGIGDIESGNVVAFFMPAKTPHQIVQKFNEDLNALVRTGALDKAFASAGALPITPDAGQAQSMIESEVAKWGEVVKAANVKVQ